MGLQRRVSLYSGLGLLFLLAILVTVGVWVVGDTTERSLNERVAVAEMVSSGVDQALWSAQDKMITLADMVDLEDEDVSPEQQMLASLYTFSGTLSHIYLIDSRGEIIDVQPSELDATVQELVKSDTSLISVLAGSDIAISSVPMPGPSGQLMFSISVPVTNDRGDLIGVVTGHIDLNRIVGSFIEPLELGSTAYLEVMNEEGRGMASSGNREAVPEEVQYAPHFASLIDKGEAAMGECFYCHEGEENGVTRTKQVLAFAPLSTVPGGVAIRQAEAEALAPSHRQLRYMLLAGSPLLVLGLIFAWMSTRMVVRPVVELTGASLRITQGDLDVPITINRNDELGQLAQTFDQMRVGLKESLAQKEERARESEQRARHLAVLNAVAVTASRSLDLKQILVDSLEQVLTFLQMPSGCVYLKEDGTSQSYMEASWNMTDELASNVPVATSRAGVADNVVFYDRTAGDESITFIGVPLVSQDRSLGEIWLVGPGPRRFTTEEYELLASIGRQIGVAVQNTHLFQDAGRRESEAQALRQLGIEVSRLLDLDTVLTTVVDSTVRLLKSEGAVVALQDDVTGQVYVRAASGILAPEFRNLRLKLNEDSLIGKAIHSGRPQFTVDYLNDNEISHSPMLDNLLRKSDLRACLLVPIRVGERVSGILMAGFRHRQSFTQEETELLQQLANQAAVALENSRLHGQVQELAIVEERARLSREMHDSLGQVLAYIGIEVDEIKRLLDSGQQQQVVAKITEVRKIVRETSEEVRNAILELRTPVSQGIELPRILSQYFESFRKQTKTELTLDVRDEAATRFTPRAVLELVRVIQEALSNVRRHAWAKKAEVTFDTQDRETVISISDDGIGFDESLVYAGGQHFGIQVMKERMAVLGGSLVIESRPGKGTRVVARLHQEANIGEE